MEFVHLYHLNSYLFYGDVINELDEFTKSCCISFDSIFSAVFFCFQREIDVLLRQECEVHDDGSNQDKIVFLRDFLIYCSCTAIACKTKLLYSGSAHLEITHVPQRLILYFCTSGSLTYILLLSIQSWHIEVLHDAQYHLHHLLELLKVSWFPCNFSCSIKQ